MNANTRRWVLVAGTGLEHGTPQEDIIAAQMIGEKLAKYGYGLVTGGWHGVDYKATESFLKNLKQSDNPKDFLIQVVPENTHPGHNKGNIVKIPAGGREWLEPQKYAEAIILIGGRGGTYRTWLGALHDGLPRFPLGGIQGDSERAFLDTIDLWELIPVPGLKLSEFKYLGEKINSQESAEKVTEYLVRDLLGKALNAIDAITRKELNNKKIGTSIFISYSRKDSDWIDRLRTLMRPAERKGIISTWIDNDIEYGKQWEEQILYRLEHTQSALLLVTENLLKSKYVREIELPIFSKRLKLPNSNFRLYWVLLEPCDWQSVQELTNVQSIGDVNSSISQSLTKSDEQCRLIEVIKKITQAVTHQ